MLRKKALRFRIFPNQEQAVLIAKTLGCSRFVFNRFLARWNESYKQTGKGLTYHSCAAQLPPIKKELPWLQEVDSTALQSSLDNLADASPDFSRNKMKLYVLKARRISFTPIPRNIQMETSESTGTKSSCRSLAG